MEEEEEEEEEEEVVVVEEEGKEGSELGGGEGGSAAGCAWAGELDNWDQLWAAEVHAWGCCRNPISGAVTQQSRTRRQALALPVFPRFCVLTGMLRLSRVELLLCSAPVTQEGEEDEDFQEGSYEHAEEGYATEHDYDSYQLELEGDRREYEARHAHGELEVQEQEYALHLQALHGDAAAAASPPAGAAADAAAQDFVELLSPDSEAVVTPVPAPVRGATDSSALCPLCAVRLVVRSGQSADAVVSAHMDGGCAPQRGGAGPQGGPREDLAAGKGRLCSWQQDNGQWDL